MKRVFRLVHSEARRRALECVSQAPEGFAVVVQEPTRNLDQNAKFHTLCGELAKSGLVWAGKRRSLSDWKAILVSGHAVATKQQGEVIPGIEGEFVAIRESTAAMSVRRSSSLIEYTLAFMAVNEVGVGHAAA